MGLKERVKTEVGYMKKGAKILPKVIGKKVKSWAKSKWEEAKEQGRIEREAEAESRKAEREGYQQARIEAARKRGLERGRQRAAGQGGILAQLGQAGQRMSVADTLGLDFGKTQKAGGSASSYIFEGLGKSQGQSPRRKPVIHRKRIVRRRRRY